MPTLILKSTHKSVKDYCAALERIVDQYSIKTDRRSGIVNDPNRANDPQYIVRLIGKVISVSLETVKIVAGLPGFGIGEREGVS